MTLINYASGHLSQTRDHNSGGFAQGIAYHEGCYGDLPVGDAGKVFAGILGLGEGASARLELKDSRGGFHTLSTGDISHPNQLFILRPEARNNIPQGGRICVRVFGPETITGTYWFMLLS